MEEQSPTRGALTYTYDALNRVITIDAPGTIEDIPYVYDTAPGCTNGIGRLCQVVDASGVTTYSYDPFGNLTQTTKTELGVNYTTQYTYDAGNRLSTIVYPDGRTLTYTRDAIGRVSHVSLTVSGTTTSLLNTLSYRADGLIKSQMFGNGLTETRSYDTKGQIVSQSVEVLLTHTYGYDLNGNLVGFAQSSFGYDLLDRVTQSSGTNTGNNSYVYEGNGDILNASFSNIASPIRADQYTYNAYGQLAEYRQGGTLRGSYVYNHQRQRTRKSAGGTTVYHYDLAGNLIQETTATGTAIRSYIWLNQTPVAQIDHGTPDKMTYLHVDHLNTPRWGTNSTGALVWKWEGEPFGQSQPNEDPDGDGILTTINLRFPGQYYDAESGLHYNWNRYYDPRTGRYITSDPIGLLGGLNTYVYANNNAFRFFDIDGLAAAQPWSSQKPTTQVLCARKVRDSVYAGLPLEIKRNDKLVHCIISCEIWKKCSGVDSMGAGIIKELQDLADGPGGGSASTDDLIADFRGWQCGFRVATAANEKCESCEQCCRSANLPGSP